MESLRQTHERKYSDLIAEIEMLDRENQKLKEKLGINDDDGIINLDDEDECSDTDMSEVTEVESSISQNDP